MESFADRKNRERIKARACRRAAVFAALLLAVSGPRVLGQTVAQPQPPLDDTARQHPRIERTEVPGRRAELTALKGARLFIGPMVKPDDPVPLIVHFHGAPWLVERHAALYLPRAAVITVQLGAGSRAYGQPFEDARLFPDLLEAAKRELGAKRGWSSITLTGFSAGYGAIRAILRQQDNAARVDGILLLDGIHAGYSPEREPIADGSAIISSDVEPFVRFAREAAAGRRRFVITHSQIFPGNYASTTECVDLILRELKLVRRKSPRSGPMGMRQLSSVDAKGFRVRGFAGDSAPDHVDHLHAMPEWVKLLKIR